jgi:predicted DNA-binding transcriptional regulator AlpA
VTTERQEIEVYTPQELAKKLGVSEQTLYKWRRSKIGPRPVYLSAQTVRYRRETVEDWIQEQEDNPKSGV